MVTSVLHLLALHERQHGTTITFWPSADVFDTVVFDHETIRARFGDRRAGLGNIDKLLRRLMGLEAKMRQYRDGAAFVRGVQEKVGIDGFNAVWAAPENLPTPAEIQRPQLWVERIHGSLFR